VCSARNLSDANIAPLIDAPGAKDRLAIVPSYKVGAARRAVSAFASR
jgi:hypothetical protein